MPFGHSSLTSVVHAAAFGCFSMGFNTGLIAGALLYLDDHFPSMASEPILKGAVTSSVFASAFLVNLCVAPLADKFGRVFVIRLMNGPFLIGAVVVACATTPEMVIVGRTITGLGVGIAGTLPNLYIAEIVPPASRGKSVGMAPLYGTLGIMAAQIFSYLVAQILGKSMCTSVGWRIMFGAGALPVIIQMVWSIGLPESPRWCLQRGNTALANKNLEYIAGLRGGARLDECSPTLSNAASPERLSYGRASIAVGLSVMQQLSGVNAVIYYAPHLYSKLGVEPNIAILIAALNSVAQVMMTRIMTLIIDSLGRRRICFIGLIGMVVGLSILGFVFQRSLHFHLPVGFAIAGILVFRLSFSLSLGPLPYILVTELFPQRQRARGVALSMMTNWLLNWAVVFVVPILLQSCRGAVFFAFAAVSVVSIVVVDLWLPETAKQDLENVADVQHVGNIVRFCRRIRRCCVPRSQDADSLLDQSSKVGDLHLHASNVSSL